MEPEIHDALKNVKEGIPRLAELLKFSDGSDMASWISIVEAKLIPRFSSDFPIVAAICGGGSSGKSVSGLLRSRMKSPRRFLQTSPSGSPK